ncbi:MAG: enolase C-terminal domain-like protein [Bacillota bacterium]
MKITEMAVTRISLPVQGLTTSYGARAGKRDYVFVRLRTAEGLCGYGEASCLPEFTGETPASVAAVLKERFRPLVVGRDPFSVAAFHRDVTRQLPHNTTSQAAVDMAFHDLIGKATKRPIADLLGGRVRTQLETAAAVGIERPEVTAQLARQYAERGHTAIKLKVGTDIERDAQAVAAVREAVGAGVALRLDANQGLTISHAYRLIRAVARHDIQYLEQPVAGWDVKGLRELRQRGGVPIAADESNLGVREALQLLQSRAVDYLVVKLVKCGGLFPAAQILHLADLHRVPCTITSPYETSIGAAANVQLAASAARLSGPIEVLNPADIPGDPGRGLCFSGVHANLPAGAGLGISVAPDLFGETH